MKKIFFFVILLITLTSMGGIWQKLNQPANDAVIYNRLILGDTLYINGSYSTAADSAYNICKLYVRGTDSLLIYQNRTDTFVLGNLSDSTQMLLDSLLVHRNELDALLDSIAAHLVILNNHTDSIAVFRDSINAHSDSLAAHLIRLDLDDDTLDAHNQRLIAIESDTAGYVHASDTVAKWLGIGNEADPIWVSDSADYLQKAVASALYSLLGHVHTHASITEKLGNGEYHLSLAERDTAIVDDWTRVGVPALGYVYRNGYVRIGGATAPSYALSVTGYIQASLGFVIGTGYVLSGTAAYGLYSGTWIRGRINIGSASPAQANPWEFRSGSVANLGGKHTFFTDDVGRFNISRNGKSIFNTAGIFTDTLNRTLTVKGNSSGTTLANEGLLGVINDNTTPGAYSAIDLTPSGYVKIAGVYQSATLRGLDIQGYKSGAKMMLSLDVDSQKFYIDGAEKMRLSTGLTLTGNSSVAPIYLSVSDNSGDASSRNWLIGNGYGLSDCGTLGFFKNSAPNGNFITTPVFILDSLGNVGIGVTFPDSLLTVNGSGHFVDDVLVDNDLTADTVKANVVHLGTSSANISLSANGDTVLFDKHIKTPGATFTDDCTFDSTITMKKAEFTEFSNATASGNIILDCANYSVFELTMSADIDSLGYTGATTGTYMIVLKQDADGGETVNWYAGQWIAASGSLTIASGASQYTYISCYYDDLQGKMVVTEISNPTGL